MARRRSVPLTLALCLFLPILMGVVMAPSSAASDPPPPRSVWTVFTTVVAWVEDNYAVVEVIADIGNEGPDPEFPFVVQVPSAAMVTGLTIERDGVVHEARIADRDEARKEYDEHKAKEMTGGLVEKQRGSQAFSFLINVAEFESVRATLRYELLLAADAGVYHLPLEAPVSGYGQDLGAAFDVRVQNVGGVASLWSDPANDVIHHEDGSKQLRYHVGARPDDASTPLDVFYSLDETPPEGDLLTRVKGGVGYFAHRFRAPADAQQTPVDLVLVLDTSGSMTGEKLAQMQDAAVQVIQGLDAQDRLHLVFFSSAPQQPWQGMEFATADRRQAAVSEVRAAAAGGGTGIDAALESGFEAFSHAASDLIANLTQPPNMPIVVFLTDGMASVGETDSSQLRTLAKEANDVEARLFGLAFGHDADWGLIAGLSRDNGGLALKVPEGTGAEVDLRRFMAALTTPVLRDVHIDYPDGVEAFFTQVPVLFAGSEMLVVGTYPVASENLAGTVTGMAWDGERSYDFDVDTRQVAQVPLERIYAYSLIRDLQERIAADGERPEWVDAIKAVALDMGFVTDYTSLVLTLDHRDPNTDAGSDEGIVADMAPGTLPIRSGRDPVDPVGDADDEHGDSAMTPGPAAAWVVLALLAVAVVAWRRRG